MATLARTRWNPEAPVAEVVRWPDSFDAPDFLRLDGDSDQARMRFEALFEQSPRCDESDNDGQ